MKSKRLAACALLVFLAPVATDAARGGGGGGGGFRFPNDTGGGASHSSTGPAGTSRTTSVNDTSSGYNRTTTANNGSYSKTANAGASNGTYNRSGSASNGYGATHNSSGSANSSTGNYSHSGGSNTAYGNNQHSVSGNTNTGNYNRSASGSNAYGSYNTSGSGNAKTGTYSQSTNASNIYGQQYHGTTSTSNGTVNRSAYVTNPVYSSYPAWGWNAGVAWYPAPTYWGGGFWGPMAVGVTSAAVYGAIVNANNQKVTSYQVESNSPGAKLLSSYHLTQVPCGPPNLVVIYGPDNSVICARPNNLVSAGNYALDSSNLTIISQTA